jgi:hypothetical protein
MGCAAPTCRPRDNNSLMPHGERITGLHSHTGSVRVGRHLGGPHAERVADATFLRLSNRWTVAGLNFKEDLICSGGGVNGNSQRVIL